MVSRKSKPKADENRSLEDGTPLLALEVDTNRERRPKTKPKTPLEEKFKEQKRILQVYVMRQLQWGEVEGFKPIEVSLLKEALEVLGWLPTDLKL